MTKTKVANKITAFIMLSLFFTEQGFGKEISIFEAVKKGLVKINLVSSGGHSENCVNVQVRHLGAAPISLVMEPGTILDNLDQQQQDIIVTKKLKMQLASHQTIDTLAYGFCCQSQNKNPVRGQRLGLSRMADSMMVALCNFINSHQVLPWVAQSAIWTCSNGHQVASIGDPKDSTLSALIKMCAAGRHLTLPWYHVAYRKIPGVVFSNEVCKVVLNFEYTKISDKNLTIAIYDCSGHKVKTLLSNSYAERGNKTYHFDVDIVNWPAGKYILKVNEWEQEAMTKTFDI